MEVCKHVYLYVYPSCRSKVRPNEREHAYMGTHNKFDANCSSERDKGID